MAFTITKTIYLLSSPKQFSHFVTFFYYSKFDNVDAKVKLRAALHYGGEVHRYWILGKIKI